MEISKVTVWPAILAFALLAGCNTVAKPASDDADEEKVVPIGSHIPIRDSARASSSTDRSSIDAMKRNSTIGNSAQGGK